MTKQYYLHDGTELGGPFLFETLKGKNISPDAHIWYEGLDEWTKASELEELNTLFGKPPFPPAPVMAQQQQQQQQRMNEESLAQKDKKKGMKVLLIILLVAALAAAGLYYANQSATGDTMQVSYEEKVMTIEEIERSMPNDFLSVLAESKENFWGNKLLIRGTLINKATLASYKDAVIKVTYYSKTMTELGSKEHTLYGHFGPNSSTPFEFKTDNYQDVEAVGLSLVSAVGE